MSASVITRDGQHHEAIYRKAALLAARAGGMYGLLGVIIDITERKQVEQVMLQAKEGSGSGQPREERFPGQHEPRDPGRR